MSEKNNPSMTERLRPEEGTFEDFVDRLINELEEMETKIREHIDDNGRHLCEPTDVQEPSERYLTPYEKATGDYELTPAEKKEISENLIRTQVLNEVIEIVKKHKQKYAAMPAHECREYPCPHYPRTDENNRTIDSIITALESLKK